MKRTLDKLLLCDLYQISENQGYIDKAEIHGKSPIGCELYRNSFVNKICSVIVKKNEFSKYNLKEILTGIPINIVVVTGIIILLEELSLNMTLSF